MDPTLGVFLALSAALNALLAGVVVARKLRRDRWERRQLGRLGDLGRAVRSGGSDLDSLVRRAVRRRSAQIDLATVLPAVVRERGVGVIPSVRSAALRTGLGPALARRVRSRRPVVRGTAALLIGHLQLADGTALVAPLLDDRDSDVRLVAARTLGALQTPESAAALIDAVAVGRLMPDRLIERLDGRWATPVILDRLAALGPERDGATQAALARALGLSGDERGEAALLELLGSPHAEARVSAARALATCGSAASHAALTSALADASWEVRAQAAMALGALGVTAAVLPLSRALNDAAWWARSNAATALSGLGTAGNLALQRATVGNDPYAAECAVEALEISARAS